MYYPPIIIVLGTIGNVLSFIVYGRKGQRKKPLSVYMRAVAIADTIMLYVLFGYWLNDNFLGQRNEAKCLVTTYFLHATANCCEYLLVAITLNRLLAILVPLKSAKSVRRAKYCVASIVMASLYKSLQII